MAFALWTAAGMACAQETAAKLTVEYVQQMPNAHYPELLYWFVTPETLAPARYKQDVQHIANDTLFHFPFLTDRNGVNFPDSPEAHAAVAGIVAEGHKAGLQVGATLVIQGLNARRSFAMEDDQTLIADAETTLDARGSGSVTAGAKMRAAPALKTELLRVYVFRKTAAGEYDPATLEDVTAKARGTSATPGTMEVTVELGSQYAGRTVFVMTTNWFKTVDLYSDTFARWIHEVIDQYKDVPLDGTSLDEFGYEKIPAFTKENFRAHFAGAAFARKFEAATGRPLTQAIFETRYAPAGHPEVRIRAIDQYWDFFRQGPLKVEQEFYRYSKQVFGAKTFAGIHDTFHNHLTNDEPWATGINWWTIPREYGQSDEDLSLPLRMGLLVSHPGKIMYDQFYGPDIQRFASKALNDARFDARLHYHGYNDTGRWGVDLSTKPFLDVMNPVEEKIRMLNQFDPAAPELPLLVVFGMPRLLNWFPEVASQNQFDVNGSLNIEEKALQIWNAGYRCAVVPSDLIDDGSLTLDAQNRPVLHGHRFRAVVYLYPEYAKAATLAWLDQYTKAGGSLMLEGTASRDFEGKPIADQFKAIVARAKATEFSVAGLAKLGVEPDVLRGVGGSLEDGSVILTDLASLQNSSPKAFSVRVNGHEFSGSYVGVFALKAAGDGRIEKLACGGCESLMRDGRKILQLKKAADIVMLPGGHFLVKGEAGENALTLNP